MTKRKKKKNKVSNRPGMIWVTLILAAIIVVVGVKKVQLHILNDQYIEKEEILISKIDAENERTKQLEEMRIYMQTNKYIEDVAKEKLGLAYPDEIIFKSE